MESRWDSRDNVIGSGNGSLFAEREREEEVPLVYGDERKYPLATAMLPPSNRRYPLKQSLGIPI